MANEQRIVELVIDGSPTEAGINRINVAYDHLGDRAAAAIAKAQAAMASQLRIFDTNVPQAIDRATAAYDKLRAKTDPVLASQLKLETDMTRSLGVINRAILLGVATEEEANQQLAQLRQQQVVQLDQVRAATDALAIRAEFLKSKFDDAYVSGNRLTADLRDLAEAEKLGVEISGGYAAALDTLVLKHDAVAAAAKRQADEYSLLAKAGREAYAEDQAQNKINEQLGIVSKPSGAAAASGAFIDEQMSKNEEIARFKAQQQGQNFLADANSWAGVTGKGTSARESASAFEDAAREVAVLRAQLDPAAASQSRLNEQLARYAELAEAGQISVEDLSKAEVLATSRHQQFVDALGKGNQPSQGMQHFQTANVAYQLQDTITQAVGGAGIGTIAIQQGPQLAMSLGEQGAGGAVKTLGAGLLTLVSSTNLAAIGLVAGGAAAIQFGAKIYESFNQTKKLDDALADQEKALKAVADAYGNVAQQASKASDSKRLADATGARSQAALTISTQVEAGTFFNGSDVGSVRSAGRYGQASAGFSARAPEFQAALTKLRADVKAGKADFDEFYESMAQAVALNPSLAVAGDKIIAESAPLKDATDQLEKLKRIRDAINADQDNAGRLRSNGATNQADDTQYVIFQSQQRIATQRSQQALAAQLESIKARSPDETIAAARATAAAQYNDNELPATRNNRIDQAGLVAQAQAEKQLSDAQRDRSLALKQLTDDQQFEISLTGKTADQSALLRKEYDLTSQLRLQAARDGTSVDQKEIDAIHDKIGELGKLQEAYKALSTGITTRGYIIGSQAEQDATDYQQDQQNSLDQGNQSYDAQIAGIRARTVAERVAAARQAAEAQHPDESAAQHDQRISQAGLLAQAQAEQQIRDAQRERNISLEQTLRDQQAEISLVGKSAGEAAALRQQYQLTSQLRLEAAKNGTAADENEIKLIAEKSKKLGDEIDLYAKAKLENDLQFERDQTTRSPIDQQIASQQRSAGLAVNLNDETAAAIRLNEELKKQTQTWNDIRDVGLSAIDQLVAGANTGLSGISDAFKNVAGDILKEFETLAIANPLKNAIFKTDLPTLDTAGGVGGFFSSLTGGKNPAAGAAQAVGSMNVSAATVMVNGGLSGGLGSNLLTGSTPIAANSNAAVAGTMSQFGSAIKAIESGGNYNTVGPATATGDHAFGAYQVMGANIPSWTKATLGQSLTPQQFLSSEQAQDAVFNKYFGQSVAKYGNANDAASVWFTGRPQAQGAGSSDILGTTGSAYVDKFNSQLAKLGDTTSATTENLAGFGNGLGQLGQNLSSAFPSAPAAEGGGGIGGWLGSLFGSSLVPNGAQATLAASGTKVGLFARGGVADKPSIFGDDGPEAAIPLPDGRSVPVTINMGRRGSSGASQSAPSSTSIAIHNYSNAKVQTEETTDERGGRQIKFIMSDKVGDAIGEKSGGAEKTLRRRYGLTPRGISR